jgi:hypothetical protein
MSRPCTCQDVCCEVLSYPPNNGESVFKRVRAKAQHIVREGKRSPAFGCLLLTTTHAICCTSISGTLIYDDTIASEVDITIILNSFYLFYK